MSNGAFLRSYRRFSAPYCCDKRVSLACQRVQRLSTPLPSRSRISLTEASVPAAQTAPAPDLLRRPAPAEPPNPRPARACTRLVSLEPQAGGQHGVYAVEVGAITISPASTLQVSAAQRSESAFRPAPPRWAEFELARILAEGEHHRFRPFIAKARRHENVGADLHLFPQLVRRTVRI